MNHAPGANRLVREASPYLRQHAANPVDWYPWGEEGLTRAAQEDKPIFLSIGYSACHWCHVMERESFNSPPVAAFLNEHFVSIKVDREERPDVDAVYMEAVQAMTGAGGWPLTVFLTPSLHPFFGGTYFPPERRWGRPSFLEVLHAVVAAWRTRRHDLNAQASALTEHLAAAAQRDDCGELDPPGALAGAVARLGQQFDPTYGGFGGAPKFPSPARLFLLLHAAARGDLQAENMLATTLEGMARGGMYDWVGGGFHRYSVDAQWLLPHFEKMLYDNALLARLYGEAGLALNKRKWLAVAKETAAYLVREMQGGEGGFFASTDADSEGEEGRFFTWTPEEISSVLPREEAAALIAACAVTSEGNFEHGRTILRPANDLAAVAVALGSSPQALDTTLSRARLLLRAGRCRRVPPALDDTRLAAWNGMAVWALAYLGVAFDEPPFLEAARRAGDFLLQRSDSPGPITRAWRDGVTGGVETLEDVAWVAAGLVELYQTTGELRYLTRSREVLHRRLPRYRGERGTLFETADDGQRLPLRPRSPHDGATPAAASVAVRACLQVAALTGDETLRSWAEAALISAGAVLSHAPEACAGLLLAALEASHPPSQLVLVGEPEDGATRVLLRTALTAPRRPTGIALSPAVPVPTEVVETVPIFQGRRGTRNQRATAYLCRDGSCDLPSQDPLALANALAALP